MELITLEAKKVEVIENGFKSFQTEFYKMNGVLKCIIPSHLKQPRKGRKTIILNGWKFNLKWLS